MDTTTIDPVAVADEIKETLNQFATMEGEARWQFIWDGFKAYLPKLLTALLILVVGVILVKMTLKFAKKLLKRSTLDPTLHSFLVSILNITLYILLGVMVLTILVPEAIGLLVALVGVFGLAASLAVKDSLANLAGGLSVLFTKPFALGDYVKINTNEGNVEEIRLNYTVMKTFDNKVVHIPNGDVAKAEIVNFTSQPTRRLDILFSIGYKDDFALAQKIIRRTLADNPMAHTDPVPVVRMMKHGDSAIVVCCRVWCNTPDYWPLHFDLLEEVKRRFDAQGINIPFNQIDVHIASPK